MTLHGALERKSKKEDGGKGGRQGRAHTRPWESDPSPIPKGATLAGKALALCSRAPAPPQVAHLKGLPLWVDESKGAAQKCSALLSATHDLPKGHIWGKPQGSNPGHPQSAAHPWFWQFQSFWSFQAQNDAWAGSGSFSLCR